MGSGGTGCSRKANVPWRGPSGRPSSGLAARSGLRPCVPTLSPSHVSLRSVPPLQIVRWEAFGPAGPPAGTVHLSSVLSQLLKSTLPAGEHTAPAGQRGSPRPPGGAMDAREGRAARSASGLPGSAEWPLHRVVLLSVVAGLGS